MDPRTILRMSSRPQALAHSHLMRVLLLPLVLLLTMCSKTEPTPEPEPAPEPPPAAPVELDLWAGVPDLVEQPGDLATTIQPRPGPAKPATVGERVELPFDPKEFSGAPPVPPGTPLEVLRHGPVGAQTLVGAVRVAFNQPMIPLASLETLRTKAVPLEIDPKPPGKARWLGTHVVVWEPEGRMPYSTTYTVTVPAGAKSTTGAELDKAVDWTFSTPTLALTSSSPSNGQSHTKLDPTISLTFNQPIQKVALMAALELRGDGKAVPLTLAPPLPTPTTPKSEAQLAREARTLRVVPSTELLPNVRYTVKLAPGTFGEGPNKSAAILVNFTTYPPLRVSWSGCGSCWATNGINLETTNTVTDAKIASKVHVTPPVDKLNVSSGWRGITLSGRFEGGTRYNVVVDAGVEDTYGQTLAKPFKKAITLGPPYPSVRPVRRGQSPVVIERGGSQEITLRVAGIEELEVGAHAVKADDIKTFVYPRSAGPDLWPRGMPAATWTDTLDVRASLKRQEETTIDLSKMLMPNRNAVWLTSRSEEVESDGWKRRVKYTELFEITNLGISAALDGKTGLLQVTQLSNGEPVAGARLTLLDRSTGHRKLWDGVTDANGVATAEFGTSTNPGLLIAETDDDYAFMRLDKSDLRNGWRHSSSTSDQPRAFIYTDRTPYKPGDTIHLAGILRSETRGPTGGVAMWHKGVTAEYTVHDARRVEVAKGETQIGPFGTFAVDIETDADGGTGNYNFKLKVTGLFNNKEFYHSIPVETYRTPEFKVAINRPDASPLLYGGTLSANVEGEYLHGAPLVGGNVAWSLTRAESGFTPPGDANRDFSFGRNVRRRHHWYSPPPSPGRTLTTGTGVLDTLGHLKIDKSLLAIEPDPAAVKTPSKPKTKVDPPPPAASTYTINATVTDENRQAIAGTSSFVVHPAAVYVGLRSDRRVLKEGQTAQLSAIAVDLDGKRTEGRAVELSVVRKETTRTAVEKDGKWTFEYVTSEVKAGACSLSSSSAPATCEVTVGSAGSYHVRGTAKDDAGNEAHSELTIYVHGKDAVVWEDSEHRIDLVADKEKYQPGDTAVVLLRSPFEEARGVVVVEREGLSKHIPVHLKGGSHVVEIPIDDTMIPGVRMSALLTSGRVEVKGVPSGQDLGRPAAATGELELEVNDAAKRIVVELTPHADRIEPGSTLKLSINTHSAAGDPTKSAVAVMVVDEGVLSLLGHKTPDPLAFFHRRRSPNVWLYALQAAVMAQADPAAVFAPEEATEAGSRFGSGGLGMMGTGRGGGGAGEGTIGLSVGGLAAPQPAPPPGAPSKAKKRSNKDSARESESLADSSAALDVSAAMSQPVSLRDVFATTAFFDAEVMTDDSGMATLEIEMPENLTTFRIMAVAVDPDHADRFGNGEATVTVRKPIMVRPSLPRFANFGDAFEGSVMVDNLSDAPQKILTGVRGLNVEITGESEKFVEIPAGESREVRFSMATEAVGLMRLQFAVMSNAGRDATELTLPVHYPATAKAFADYGVVDTATQRLLEPPTDALPDFGGLEVSLSSTALSGLEDAVEYLVSYPYECAEQTASRMLPIFALSDIINEFPIASVADKTKRDLLVADGIKRLLNKQNPDGGFGYWTKGESWPYLTNWVALSLLEGKAKGYAVDAAALDRALNYVENFVRHGHHTRWGRYYDWTSRAFGLWLLSGEKRGEDLFDRVWGHRGDLPLYARAQLMTVAHRFGKTVERDALRAELDDAIVESAKAAHFAENRSEAYASGLSVLMHSNVQTDAIVMMALLEVTPTDPILPKVMAGIMADRDPRLGGRWGSTHANAWALLGASRYYDTVEGAEPDFVARVWLDEDYASEAKFAGRSMTTVDQRVAMTSVTGAKERVVTIAKDGPGKLYYRLGLRYAPKDLKLPAEDQGFLVYREYEALPDAAGVLDKDAVQRSDDGSWIVKAGTDVRVTIHVVARDRASYVVVDDGLPAGFEGQNPRFVTSGAAAAHTTPTATPGRWWWPWWRFSHTDLRDDRMLLFADSMPAGVYSYSYTARATTIGRFHLPPIKAEAMYEPERFGHSASSEVRVVE